MNQGTFPMSWSDVAYSESLELYQSILGINEGPEGLRNAVDNRLGFLVLEALSILEKALRLFGPEHTLISFNGGKDAVVILHLFRAAYAAYCKSTHLKNDRGSQVSCKPRLLFFRHVDEFEEMEEFIQDTAKLYDMDLAVTQLGYQEGLVECLNRLKTGDWGVERKATHHPLNGDRGAGGSVSVPAFILGVRNVDPESHMRSVIEANDDAWFESQCSEPNSTPPAYLQVYPILAWGYGDVWAFLKRFSLSYCSLYDKGYTSLGTKLKTFPNPLLHVKDGEFRPAWTLTQWRAERLGRGVVACRKNAETDEDAVATIGLLGVDVFSSTTPSLVESSLSVASQCFRNAGISLSRMAHVCYDSASLIAELDSLRLTCDFAVVLWEKTTPEEDKSILELVEMSLLKIMRKKLAWFILQRLKYAKEGDPLRRFKRSLAHGVVQYGQIFLGPGTPEAIESIQEGIWSSLNWFREKCS